MILDAYIFRFVLFVLGGRRFRRCRCLWSRAGRQHGGREKNGQQTAGLFYVFVCHNYSSNIHYYNYMEKKRTHELKFDEKQRVFQFYRDF